MKSIHLCCVFNAWLLCASSLAQEQSPPQTEEEPEVIEIRQTAKSLSAEHSINAFAQSQASLTSQAIQQFGSSSARDLSTYIANVQVSRLGAGMGEDYAIRGFHTGGRLLLDGVLDNQSYYVRDPATYQSVTFIKGQNSTLYGAGSPGGAVNFVAKKPRFTPANTLSFALGNRNYRWLTLDSTGAVASSKQFAYRSVLSTGHAQSWKENVEESPLTLLNAMTWRNDQSKITGSWEYSHQNRPYDFDNVFAHGRPVYGVSYVHPASSAHNKFHRFELQFTHELPHAVELEAIARHITGERKAKQIGFYYLVADDQPLKGFYKRVNEDFAQTTVQFKAGKVFQLNGLEQESIVGLSVHQTTAEYHNHRGVGLFSLDIYKPRFDFKLPTIQQLQARMGSLDWSEKSLFFQQNSQISQTLRATFGSRFTNYKLSQEVNSFEQPAANNRTMSYSAGVEWLADEQLSLRASYNRSWLPNAGQNQQHRYFESSQGEHYELGGQWSPLTNTTIDLALFHIQQSNLLVKDPIEPEFYILAGEKHVMGSELNVKFLLSAHWQLNWTSSLLKSSLKKSLDSNEGNRFAGIPKHQHALLLSWHPNDIFDATLGMQHQARRPGNLANNFWVNSYTRYDLSARWHFSKRLRLQAGIVNLTNINYVEYASAVDFLRFGEPRTSRLTLHYNF